jgi:uncharacterized protein involved in response to NO
MVVVGREHAAFADDNQHDGRPLAGLCKTELAVTAMMMAAARRQQAPPHSLLTDLMQLLARSPH